MIMKGKDKMIAGRVKLIFTNPFFGMLATQLGLIETDKVPTAGTDGKCLMFNPEFTDSLSRSEIVFLICHEVMHVVLLTHLRLEHRDFDVFNQAADFAINLILNDEGFSFIDGGLLEEKFRDWSAEKIYAHLIENPDQQAKSNDWNIGAVMPGSLSEDGEPQPMTEEDIKREELRVKTQIQAAAASARKAGKLSKNISKIIDQICAPKANWRTILQQFLSEKAFVDWEYGTCHTRMLHQYGVISPVIGGESLGKLAMIIDTSGSVNEKELAQFAGEINDVLESYECEVTVIYCDTKISHIEHWTSDDLPLVLSIKSTGGTIQKPAYDWVAENLSDASALIAFTDSHYFDWKEIEEPHCPSLMACTSSHVANDVPPWMEVIDISEEKS